MSVRWYLRYDLHEPLQDHSSFTRLSDRYGLEVFRAFFEHTVERRAEARLVWDEELYFDATKVEANASLESSMPRFAVEQHLQYLLKKDPQEEPAHAANSVARPADEGDLDHYLPKSDDERLTTVNAVRSE